MSRPLTPLDRRVHGEPLDDDAILALAEAPAGALVRAAAAVRDRAFGRTVTYSPKVFLPVTNLCRNRCSYCSFRRSPGDAGEWTMAPSEVRSWLVRAREQGCGEALLCLGDKPESAFGSYREQLAGFGHASTVDYLVAIAEEALALGLLPHTNAGVLTRDDMARLRPLNVSMGLMLESASERLCEPGMPHHRAPDKRPARRLAMIDEAGALGVAFTTGILVGIGETRRERAEALLAIRALSRRHGHVHEVIVQPFRDRPGIAMHPAPDPTDDDVVHAVALARLALDDEVTVQAPPNLHAHDEGALLGAGINDFGGISPVSPDYINPAHAWPHLSGLARRCDALGFTLAPRTALHARWAQPAFVDPRLDAPLRAVARRLALAEPLFARASSEATA